MGLKNLSIKAKFALINFLGSRVLALKSNEC